MKAVRIHEHGDTDVLVWEEVIDPTIKPDQALVAAGSSPRPA